MFGNMSRCPGCCVSIESLLDSLSDSIRSIVFPNTKEVHCLVFASALFLDILVSSFLTLRRTLEKTIPTSLIWTIR